MTFTLADLSDLALTYTVTYGASMIFLVLFLGASGLPMPGTFLVLAAGAFVRQGVLDLYSVFGLALLGAVLGDSLSYGMGRFARKLILKRFGKAKAWQKAERNLERRGGTAIYLTRWLLTPIAIPTNLVAGSGGYPYRKFVLYDVAGELTWLLIFGGLGYTFSSQWEAMSEFIGNFSGVLVGIAILGTGLYLIFRKKEKPQMEENLVGAGLTTDGID
ncbi:MAG: DedA family protein [Chloroflexota bacterium]